MDAKKTSVYITFYILALKAEGLFKIPGVTWLKVWVNKFGCFTNGML